MLIFFILGFGSSKAIYTQTRYSVDLKIYGGSPAAIMAAVEISQSGKSFFVDSQDVDLGGLTTGGLGFTETDFIIND